MAAGLTSGAIGQLAGFNLAEEAAISGGAWAPEQPLSNIIANATAKSPRHIGAPARQEQPANLAASQFDLTWTRNYGVNLVGVIFHTLSLDARYRISTVANGGDLDHPEFVSDWIDVYGRLFDTALLPFEAPNWFTGQITQKDIDLYPRHLWIPLGTADEDVRVLSGLRIEFDDATNPGGWFDVGGVFVASSWSPAFNFDFGRVLGAEDRSKVEETPSGRMLGDSRRSRRTHEVTWSFLDKAEAWAFYDMWMRAGTTKPVLFVPDIGDPVGLQREAFPATFGRPNAPRMNRQNQIVVTATLREIIT